MKGPKFLCRKLMMLLIISHEFWFAAMQRWGLLYCGGAAPVVKALEAATDEFKLEYKSNGEQHRIPIVQHEDQWHLHADGALAMYTIITSLPAHVALSKVLVCKRPPNAVIMELKRSPSPAASKSIRIFQTSISAGL